MIVEAALTQPEVSKPSSTQLASMTVKNVGHAGNYSLKRNSDLTLAVGMGVFERLAEKPSECNRKIETRRRKKMSKTNRSVSLSKAVLVAALCWFQG